MKKINSILVFLLLLGALICSEIQFGSGDDNFVDGPYLMLNNSGFTVYDIADSTLATSELPAILPLQLTIPYWNKEITIIDTSFSRPASIYPAADSVFVLSDIHGQHNRFELLLKKGGVIDEDRNWSFGSNTLVVNGDVFDRGPQVTQSLWLIYHLEQQAAKAGGAVHFLLGNHEMMIMRNDNRYIHDSYTNITENLTGLSYNELFGENSLLGKWLRTRNTVIKIGNTLYNHAGLSVKMTSYTLDEINQFILANYQNSYEELKADEKLSLFYRSWGPLWYRGYFQDGKRYEQITVDELSTVLTTFQANRIVVGHTTQEGTGILFQGKVIYVDSGIKYGNKGEASILTNTGIYKVTEEGIVK